MRLVQVTIPAGKRETILSALDDEGVDYVVTEETSGREFTDVAYFPLPTGAVEPVLDTLRDAGLSDDAYTVVIDAETVISRRFEELEERYAEEEKSEERIAREELKTKADDLAPPLGTYTLMTAVSALIATAGLLLDSPAVVVGSMVIAPLIGPAMATSVGTVLDDSDLFRRGVKLQVLGLGLAVVVAAAFAFSVKALHFVQPGLEITQIAEIRERLAPDFLSLAVALGAGVAGVISLSTGVSAALVGVMIAVALMPPAATIGIGIAWGMPMVSVGSGILALVNWLSINLAALVMLWYKGYRPEHWFRLSETRKKTFQRVGALVVAILLLSVFLGGVTYSTYQSATFEETARAQTQAAINSYDDSLVLLEFRVEYSDSVPFRTPQGVVATVGRPADNHYQGLAGRVDRYITDATGRDVTVQVRFVELSRSG